MYNETELIPRASINVLNFENEEVDSLFLPQINEAYDELRVILPNMPAVMNVSFGTNYPYGDDGITGSALSPDSMKIGIRLDQEDRTSQFDRIKDVIFHEGYHIGQGFYNSDPCSALEAAIYEGCATVFEKECLGVNHRWGDYSQHGEETLVQWFEQIKEITADEYFEPSGDTWRKWAFYDSDTDESWKIYKVGTWITEKIMASRNLNSVDLNAMSAAQIIKML